MNGIRELSILRAYLRTLALPQNLFETTRQNFQDSLRKIFQLSELACDFLDAYNPTGFGFKNDNLYDVSFKINSACHNLFDKITNYEEPKNPDFVIYTGWVEPASDAYKNLFTLIYEFFQIDNSD